VDITETQLEGTTVLALAGRLDGLASPGLEQKVATVLAAGQRRLLFDCSRLTYVSSAGLRVFLLAAKKLKAAGGKAAFAALTPGVQEVFELAGFLAVLEVYPTVTALA
jgi:anti-anti-sigma factor